MSLRRTIRRSKALIKAAAEDMEIPGEPLIYSVKYNIGKRRLSPNHFRTKQWASLLKCSLPAYVYTSTPVVLIVRFYVTPFEKVKISKQNLKKEKTMATFAYELCDYLLAFMEMLFQVLIHSYKQFVKIDMEKYYSSKPRTVFKFMKWEHYVEFQNNNSANAKAKGKRPVRSLGKTIQSFKQGNDGPDPVCKTSDADGDSSPSVWTSVFDSALPSSGAARPMEQA